MQAPRRSAARVTGFLPRAPLQRPCDSLNREPRGGNRRRVAIGGGNPARADPFVLHAAWQGAGIMDSAFLSAGALGGAGLVVSLIVAIVADGGKMTRPDTEESAAREPVIAGNKNSRPD